MDTLAPALSTLAEPDAFAPVIAGPARRKPNLMAIALMPARERRSYEAAMSVAEVLDLRALVASQGRWVPACGGTETPFTTRSGARLLYCWQPSTGKHAYLNVETDLILSDEEAEMLMGRAA